MKNWPLQDHVFWYRNRETTAPCRKDIHTDIAIIGGGMAGLSAAQAFHKRGKKVALFEQYYCGSGATGKSSGFITPNAELSFTDFAKRYSGEAAHHIWTFIMSGLRDIKNNIEQHTFSCDYTPQDSLEVAISNRALKELAIEYENLTKYGHQAALYNAHEIKNYIGSNAYYGGIRYEKTFGINGYAYCQEMKKMLEKSSVTIFEETPVTAINGHTLITPHAAITADYIIICADRFLPQLGRLSQSVYHAQTFIIISEPLTPEQKVALFPHDQLMVWDTHLIYNYFRLTSDNRLILGGGTPFTTYAAQEKHNYTPIVTKLRRYFERNFPHITLHFEQVWPGLIGLSKDIAPIAGPDNDDPSIYYITAATGLPIAAALGRYSAEHLLDGARDLDHYFSPYRSFPISGTAQSILGTKLSFMLSNIIKYNIP